MKLFDQDGKLDADVEDVLYEMGNVGVGMASITIGKILGVRVELETPKVIPVVDISDKTLLERVEQENIGIWMKFEAPMKGSVLFILNQAFVYDVVEKMTGSRYEEDALYEDEVAFSAITEFANMLSAAYMKAIGKYTGIRIFMSPFMLVFDEEKVSLGDFLDKQGTVADKAIWIETSFQLLDEEGDKTSDFGRVIMLPDDNTVALLMEALGL